METNTPSLTFNKSKSMLNSSALGFAGMCGFQTKAEALQYAINFTATDTENGTKANYEAAQEMFDFICKNVKLPDVDYSRAQVDELLETTNKMLLVLASKLRKEQDITEAPTPPNNEDNPEDNEEESEMYKEWFGEICDCAAEFAKQDMENMPPETLKALEEIFETEDEVKASECSPLSEECCEVCDECGPSEAPPARPETEPSQNRITFDPRVTPVGV